MRRLTVRVLPALILPTGALNLIPLPEAISLTPVAWAFPELVIVAL